MSEGSGFRVVYQEQPENRRLRVRAAISGTRSDHHTVRKRGSVDTPNEVGRLDAEVGDLQVDQQNLVSDPYGDCNARLWPGAAMVDFLRDWSPPTMRSGVGPILPMKVLSKSLTNRVGREYRLDQFPCAAYRAASRLNPIFYALECPVVVGEKGMIDVKISSFACASAIGPNQGSLGFGRLSDM